MFIESGVAYSYLCYGIYEMFNIVTSVAGDPKAILIRPINPIVGIDTMLVRKGLNKFKSIITSGTGAVTKALGISSKLDSVYLIKSDIWLEDRGISFISEDISSGMRMVLLTRK